MSTYANALTQTVIDFSNSKNWNTAVNEWDIINCEEDLHHQSMCICGKENLRYLYTIQNRFNDNILFPIGSSCIRRFNRQDLNEFTSIHESLFKLLHALQNGQRIELNSQFFSRKLLRFLYENNAFKPSVYNNGQPDVDYQFMLNMFNQHTSLSPNQQKKVNAIIAYSIKPYLETILANKIH